MNSFLEKSKFIPKSCVGNKGSIFIADTSGLHRGGYCMNGFRFMLTLVYYPDGDPWVSRVRVKGHRNLTDYQQSFLPLSPFKLHFF